MTSQKGEKEVDNALSLTANYQRRVCLRKKKIFRGFFHHQQSKSWRVLQIKSAADIYEGNFEEIHIRGQPLKN